MSSDGDPRPDTDERLSALLDGELTAEEAAQLRAELAGSPELRQRLEALRSVDERLRGLPLRPVPPDLHARLRARIAEEAPGARASAHRSAPRRPSWLRPAVAAAALAAAAAAAVLWLPRRDAPSGPDVVAEAPPPGTTGSGPAVPEVVAQAPPKGPEAVAEAAPPPEPTPERRPEVAPPRRPEVVAEVAPPERPERGPEGLAAADPVEPPADTLEDDAIFMLPVADEPSEADLAVIGVLELLEALDSLEERGRG